MLVYERRPRSNDPSLRKRVASRRGTASFEDLGPSFRGNKFNYLVGEFYMRIPVKNRRGTSFWDHPSTDDGSWLRYWMTQKGVSYRPVCECCKRVPAEVGGHVIKVNSYYDRDVYIVPLCRACNNRSPDNPFEVESSMLVSAASSRFR